MTIQEVLACADTGLLFRRKGWGNQQFVLEIIDKKNIKRHGTNDWGSGRAGLAVEDLVATDWYKLEKQVGEIRTGDLVLHNGYAYVYVNGTFFVKSDFKGNGEMHRI